MQTKEEKEPIEPIPFIDILPKNFKVKPHERRRRGNFCINFGQWNDTAKTVTPIINTHNTREHTHCETDKLTHLSCVLFGCFYNAHTACYGDVVLESANFYEWIGNHSINKSFICSLLDRAWADMSCVCDIMIFTLN